MVTCLITRINFHKYVCVSGNVLLNYGFYKFFGGFSSEMSVFRRDFSYVNFVLIGIYFNYFLLIKMIPRSIYFNIFIDALFYSSA